MEKQPGRPKLNRSRQEGEPDPASQSRLHCSLCKGTGHNKRTCIRRGGTASGRGRSRGGQGNKLGVRRGRGSESGRSTTTQMGRGGRGATQSTTAAGPSRTAAGPSRAAAPGPSRGGKAAAGPSRGGRGATQAAAGPSTYGGGATTHGSNFNPFGWGPLFSGAEFAAFMGSGAGIGTGATYIRPNTRNSVNQGPAMVRRGGATFSCQMWNNSRPAAPP